MKIIDKYLAFLQEREWNDDSDPGTTKPSHIRKVLSTLSGSGDLAQIRQSHQPSVINIYLKRCLGDYRGRADMLNTYRYKKVGFKDWEDAKKLLQKAMDHENKIEPEKFLKGIKTVQNISREPLGKEIGPDGESDDGYTDGTSFGGSMAGDGG